MAASAAVLLGGALLAAAAEPNGGQNQSAMPGSAGIIQTSTLTGTTVLGPQSQKLGRIKDVLLDSQTGKATFVVLDAEVPGLGHAMLVVPYQALRVSINPSDNRQSVVLDLRPDRLHAAPQIQNNQWQVLQNPQFLEQARNFYQAGTSSAERTTDKPSTPCPPTPCAVPRPSADPGQDGPRRWWSSPVNDGRVAGGLALPVRHGWPIMGP